MNIWIFIIVLIIAFGIVSVLVVDDLYHYAVFVAPVENATIDEEYSHMDYFLINATTYPFAIKNLEYQESDDSIIINFGKSNHHHFDNVSDFFNNTMIQKDQTFVFHCQIYEDETYLGIYKYYGTGLIDGEKYLMFWHLDAKTTPSTQCVYPDIIKYTIDAIPTTSTPSKFDYVSDFKQQYDRNNMTTTQ